MTRQYTKTRTRDGETPIYGEQPQGQFLKLDFAGLDRIFELLAEGGYSAERINGRTVRVARGDETMRGGAVPWTLLALWRHTGDNERGGPGTAYPSVGRLARLTGYSVRQVRNAIRALESLGIITTTQYESGKSEPTASVYDLHRIAWYGGTGLPTSPTAWTRFIEKSRNCPAALLALLQSQMESPYLEDTAESYGRLAALLEKYPVAKLVESAWRVAIHKKIGDPLDLIDKLSQKSQTNEEKLREALEHLDGNDEDGTIDGEVIR